MPVADGTKVGVQEGVAVGDGDGVAVQVAGVADGVAVAAPTTLVQIIIQIQIVASLIPKIYSFP